MSDIMSVLEGKINQLNTDLQNAKAYLCQINESVEKLANDKKNVTEQILGMTGAIQAYTSTLEYQKKGEPVKQLESTQSGG